MGNKTHDTCSTIIDLLTNPTRMLIQPEVKIEGKTLLRKNAAIDGGFKLTIPFALQLEPMSFLGEVTEVEEFEHDTRYKIRNSLLESSVVSTITNALPFGAEVSVLMSNYPRFPIDMCSSKSFSRLIKCGGILDSLSVVFTSYVIVQKFPQTAIVTFIFLIS